MNVWNGGLNREPRLSSIGLFELLCSLNFPAHVSEDSSSAAIDYLINQRARTAGLELNPRADRRTLIRRVSLDLTGLPPTREQVAAFLA